MTADAPEAVDLYWLPLGAGGHVVRLNGAVFEAVAAWRDHRPRCDLYHAALTVTHASIPSVIEMTPAWGVPDGDRGVVRQGPVGWRPLGRSRAFRYEVRCWPHGVIPDVAAAVASPQRLSQDAGHARAVLDLAPRVPALTWGRDELAAGDMWNSNSLVAWLLAASGHDTSRVAPPGGGRAPGWRAGLALAARPVPTGEDVRPCPHHRAPEHRGGHGAEIRP